MSDTQTATLLRLRPTTLVDQWVENFGQLSAPDDWSEGQRIGPFLLKRPLGRGGMGLVWLAEQQEPFVRDVAIKVMLGASRSPLAEAFFQVERQALAQLSHRTIAQIYDAGQLPNGALFFAMEYVPGQPLNQYLGTNKLRAKDLAALMIQVCQGIQHAHQRGLIHRDIKPANILITEVDGVSQPKIIDFGIAIGCLGTSASKSRIVDVAGTAAYMSPEQRAPGPEGIDARSDVYALGAVLAECLYVLAGLGHAAERDDSTVWRGHLAASLTIKGVRAARLDPAESARASRQLATLPSELRAIALRAMAEQRESRYGSALAMAEDLRRWLDSEPVHAVGKQRGYVLRCFVRRHAVASAAAAIILLALIVGIVTALYGLREARIGRDQAQTALSLAERRRHDAETLVEFMLGDFADKLRDIGRLDLLDAVGQEALGYLAKEQVDDSEASAMRRSRAYRTIAGVLISRNKMSEADAALSLAGKQLRAHREHSTNPELFELLAEISFRQGRVSFAKHDLVTTEPFWREQLAFARRAVSLAPQSLGSKERLSNALLNLAALEAHPKRNQTDAALGLLDESIALKQALLAANHATSRRQLANAWAWRASVLLDAGRDAEAWKNQQEAVALFAGADLETLESTDLYNHTEIYLSGALLANDLGRTADARQMIASALDSAERRAMVDTSDVRALGSLARTALHAALMADDSRSLMSKHRELIDQCLHRPECTQQYGQELLALKLLVQSRFESVPMSDVQSFLTGVLASEQPKLDVLRSAAILVRNTDPKGTSWSDFQGRLQAKLDAVGATRQASIRYSLVRQALLEFSASNREEVTALARTIEQRRALVGN